MDLASEWVIGTLARDMAPSLPSDPTSEPPTPLEGPSESHNVGRWISRAAALHPERRAWSDDTDAFTYQEAEARIDRLTAWLLERGVSSGDRIAIWLGNRVATLEALFACARIGAIALPVNARLTASEVAFQLDDSQARLVFVEPAWRDRAAQALALTQDAMPECIEVDARLARTLAEQTPSKSCAAVTPEHPMILMYTSGTTGKPKGALLPHRKALYNSRNAERYFELRSDDHVLVVAPLFHSLGLQILALPALYVGASVRVQEGFDAERVWQTIEAERITYFGGVPTMHQRLLDALSKRGHRAKPPATLRFAFTAGAAAPKELIRSFHEHGLQLKQGYGQTETSTLTCLAPEHALSKAGSVGRPVHHAELRLVDPATIEGPVEQWLDAAAGEVGEIVVKGPITMLGYWRRPEATAETLRDGWLRTGDLATRDVDFDITLVGRAREMFISGGENVYPAEVEATLVEHPRVAEAAVVAIPDPEWGESGEAHVVLTSTADAAPIDGDEILDWLAGRLAGYKLPKSIFLETELPRTASGKVQKHRLRSRSGGGNEERTE